MRLTCLLLALFCLPPLQAAEVVRVAVAANFRGTLEGINDAFEKETRYRVVLSSASTGTLYNQIIHGAPFDLFLAADASTPRRLAAERGGNTFCYAMGRLVLVGGDGTLSQLSDPALSLAIANPETAPYGAAALEVTTRPEFDAGRERRVVRGNNVAQAYQFWRAGGADLALVAKALAPDGREVPLNWHRPVEQHAIALSGAATSDALAAYMKWIRSDRVRSQITESGYDPCP